MQKQNYRLNVIQFLMTMFESMTNMPNFVKEFKLNCNTLLKQFQISREEYEIVLSIYGVLNTDTYKPNANDMKLMQIKFMMTLVDNALSRNDKVSAINQLKEFQKNGTITAEVKDIIFKMYGFEQLNTSGVTTGRVSVSKPNTSSMPRTYTPPVPEPKKEEYVDPCRRGSGYRSRC